MPYILIVDSDPRVRREITDYAKKTGYDVDEAEDGINAIKIFRRREYDAIILDVFLPELDGIDVVRQIRKKSGVPVIFLTAKSREHERLAGFEAGADDYVIKPFYVSELFARLNVLMARGAVSRRTVLSIRGLSVDLNSREVYVDEKPAVLTPREYDLLVFLMENPNIALSRETILKEVWGPDFEGTDRTVDTHIRTLREAIKPYSGCVMTVWGIGYKLDNS